MLFGQSKDGANAPLKRNFTNGWLLTPQMQDNSVLSMETIVANAKFNIGQIVRHKIYPFRGVIFDVDPEFDNTEEWWEAIPEDVRPKKEQPFYHLFAENDSSYYTAYVSEQNLIPDTSGDPVDHPHVEQFFGEMHDGFYEIDREQAH